MADNQTRLIIQIDTILRNLDRTMKGLSQVERQLRTITAIKPNPQNAAQLNRSAIAAQRLLQQQQRLDVQSQRLAVSQERVRQASERLKLSQDRLEQQASKTSSTFSKQADAHVKAFRAIEKANRDSVVAFGLSNKQLLSLGNSLRSIGQGFASLGATLTVAVSAPLTALAAGAVDAAVRLDSLTRGLTAITGSSELAQQQLARLTKIAKLPGIGFEEAIQGSIRLQAVGFSAGEAEKALVQFSNAVALTGGSRDELNRVTVQLGQLSAKGKVLAQDLKPIIEAAPAVGQALLKAFGTVNSEDIQELGLSSKQFLDILVKELERLPRAASGARNSFDNFRDTVFQAAATVGSTLLPALTRLVEIAGPAITALANAFKALPAPIQSSVFALGALAVAAGPLFFIFGQLTTGIGRVVVGFVQLNALGLLPSIANFRLLGQVMIGTASLAQGAAATAAAAAVGWGLLVAAIVGIVAVTAAIATLSSTTEKHNETTEEQIASTQAVIKTLIDQRQVLRELDKQTDSSEQSNEKLRETYDSLNKASQARVLLAAKEVGMNLALRRELSRLIHLQEDAQQIQAATIATSITKTAADIEQFSASLDHAVTRINRLRQAREALATRGTLTQLEKDTLLIEDMGLVSLDSAEQLRQVDRRIAELSDKLPDLADKTTEAQEKMEKLSDQLFKLEAVTGKSTQEILEQARTLGLFRGNAEEAAKGIEAFREAQIKLQAALSGVNEEILRQRVEVSKLGTAADTAQKQRQALINNAIDSVREESDSIEEAKKKLEEFKEKHSEVGKAIEEEAKKRPIDEFLREATGLKKKPNIQRTETALRNAREQLAEAIANIALAQAEKEASIQKLGNDRLLRENENAFRLNLRSYTLYLSTRAQLTKDNVQLEIDEQQKLLDKAVAQQQRFTERAQKAGVPKAERVRSEAGAKKAEEDAIKAQKRLIELKDQQAQADEELAQAVAEHLKQQASDIKDLDIEYAELRGAIQDALDTELLKKYSETLKQLADDQKTLNTRIEAATKARRADELQILKQRRAQNQAQIEAIEGIVAQRLALNQLAPANNLIERAKTKQAQLERELAFEVEFRGLKEEEAIRRRLDGEEKLADSLRNSRDQIQLEVNALEARGVQPPQALLDFIKEVNSTLLGLGELSFSEKFALVEKEFNRLNDERQAKIADVERAIRNRDIAEAEGLLFIRKINGQYAGDLEQQLRLLKQIAEASGDANLRQQAQQADQTVKDANERLADLGTQLRSVRIDALRDGFAEFFKSLRDNSTTAQQKLLNLLDSVVARIEDVIAENLSRRLVESIFGKDFDAGKIVDKVKDAFGGNTTAAAHAAVDLGHGAATGAAHEVASATALQTGATAAATTLQTGAVTAAATETASATTFAAAITTAATTFAAAVTAAASAFAATVAASGAASGLGSFAGAGAGGSFALGDIIPARRGGVLARVAEAGHSEAVLTSDPAQAARQARLLGKFLRMTRGLQGRFPIPLAEGAIISPHEVEASLLSGLQRTPTRTPNLGSTQLAGVGGGANRVRFVLTDERSQNDWLNSSEGEKVFRAALVKNRPLIADLSGRRR